MTIDVEACIDNDSVLYVGLDMYKESIVVHIQLVWWIKIDPMIFFQGDTLVIWRFLVIY